MVTACFLGRIIKRRFLDNSSFFMNAKLTPANHLALPSERAHQDNSKDTPQTYVTFKSAIVTLR